MKNHVFYKLFVFGKNKEVLLSKKGNARVKNFRFGKKIGKMSDFSHFLIIDRLYVVIYLY